MNYITHSKIVFVEQKEDIIKFSKKFENITYMIDKVVEAASNVDYNANIPLLLDCLYYDFMKGE